MWLWVGDTCISTLNAGTSDLCNIKIKDIEMKKFCLLQIRGGHNMAHAHSWCTLHSPHSFGQ